MQTSIVFSQKTWFGAGDIDDCWVLSSIQAQNVTAPWLRLVSVPTYRVAAGNPDRPGPTGGSLEDTMQATAKLFPEYTDLLHKLRDWSWDDFADMARAHHPMSVSVVSGKLPPRLRFGFTGYHRITVVVKGNGQWLMANPLAKTGSRWQKVNPTEIRPAIMAYGSAKANHAGCWAVAFPTDAQMAETYHATDDTTPFDQEDLDNATAELAAKIAAAKEALK